MTGHGWWQENRLWLAALPLCLALAAAASSYNVKDLWYDQGLHHEVASGKQGDWLEVSQDYTDRVGDTSRVYRVRLREIEKTALWPYYEDGPRQPPDGIDPVIAYLDWSAMPDQQLSGCHLALEDDAGRRYELDSSDDIGLCTPADQLGPSAPDSADDDRDAVEPGGERPRVWSTAPVFLVPEGRRITRLLVSWGPPDYVTLAAS